MSLGAAFAGELRALREVFRSPDLRRLQIVWLLTAIAEWGTTLVYADDLAATLQLNLGFLTGSILPDAIADRRMAPLI